VIVAAIFSWYQQEDACSEGANAHQPPQPMLQDSTDNNVQDLRNQVAAAQQKAAQQAANSLPLPDPSLAIGTPAQQAAVSPYGPNGSASTLHSRPAVRTATVRIMQQQLSPQPGGTAARRQRP